MNKLTTLAFIVWAIDRDVLSLPVITCWKMFQKDAWGIYRNYTDPSDKLLYIPSLVEQDPIKVFTDYILCYAKMYIQSSIRDYGKLNQQIINS